MPRRPDRKAWVLIHYERKREHDGKPWYWEIWFQWPPRVTNFMRSRSNYATADRAKRAALAWCNPWLREDVGRYVDTLTPAQGPEKGNETPGTGRIPQG